MSTGVQIDADAFRRIYDEARKFLGFDADGVPIPADEVVEQAKAEGYDGRDARGALDLLVERDEFERVEGGVRPAQTPTIEAGSSESQGSNPRVDAAESDEDGGREGVDAARVLEAFETAVEFYHEQLSRDISDETGEDGPDTPREYFEDCRGWDRETVEDKLLGYAPASSTALLDELMREGFDRDEILGTGLFYEDLTPHFVGRYVLPYFDEDGRPCYAISRSLNEHEDGHTADPKGNQKYTKAQKTPEFSHVDEPIYGLETVEPGEELLVAGGIADAVALHAEGYACISPVTTVRFKNEHMDRVGGLVEEYNVDGVYMLNDAERPTVNEVETDGPGSIGEALTVEQYGEGLRGAFANCEFLEAEGVDAYLAELPGGDDDLDKLDPDEYIQDCWGGVEKLLASAKPAEQDDRFLAWKDRRQSTPDVPEDPAEQVETGGERSALFDLDIFDVTGLSDGYRGKNPLGHHGNSENYFVFIEKNGSHLGYDHKYGVGYYPLPYLLCEAGERRADSPTGDLDDAEVFAAWKHAKEGGYIPEDDKIPRNALRHVARVATDWDGDLVEHETRDGETFEGMPSGVYRDALEYIEDDFGLETGRHRPSERGGDEPEGEHEAVLPDIENRAVETGGFVDFDDDVLTEARDRAEEKVLDAVTSNDQVVVEAIPTLGKSRGAVKAAAETDEQVAILTSRNELYDQVEEWADEFGASVQRLPTFPDKCPTANGTHGDDWEETVRELYNAGATGSAIHAYADPPCQEDGACPYSRAWDKVDDENTDILVGNYLHAHVPTVQKGRTLIFDEFPEDTFTETLTGDEFKQAVTTYVETVDALPFDDYTEILERRDDEVVQDTVTEYFERGETVLCDTERAVHDEDFHACAPAVVLGLVTSEKLGNGWEHAEIDTEGVASVAYNREAGVVHVHAPPHIGEYTRGVVALDGTPTVEMWETALGTRMNHTQVLTDEERREYLTDGLNLSVVQTTEYVKPYSSGENVNVAKDEALLEAVARKHGEDVDLISTKSALHEYPGEREKPEDDPVVDIDGVGDHKWFGGMKGSNEFKTSRLGAVVGSRHYGDGFIKKWGALMGENAERGEEKGAGLSYGETGDKIHAHMTEHEVAQALLRFGRDGNGAVVYVATCKIPDWIPREATVKDSDTKDVVKRTRSDAEREVMRKITDEGRQTTAELAEVVDVSRRQVYNITEKLEDEGLVERENIGNGYEFAPTDDTVDASDLADVDLDDLEITAVDPSEDRFEETRRLIHTWNFEPPASSRQSSPRDGVDASTEKVVAGSNGGGRPPDDT